MASLQKGKKVVNQEALRRLMKEKKQSSERQKRVESPYAKYNSVGQLSCVLCNAPLKSALLWQTHVLGKQHRDKVLELKNRDSASTPPAPSSSSSSSSSSAPKRKRPAPENASASGTHAQLPRATGAAGGLGLLAGHYEDDEDDDEGSSSNAEGGLPLDFFDSGVSAPPAVSHSGSISKPDEEEEEERRERKEALPEGFFDDPVRDAQVRQVDTPQDQMEREWEDFQKEMRQVNSASEAIVAEEDEEGRLERQIDEIDEQIQCFQRVQALRSRQEQVRSGARRRRETHASADEEEEEEEEELEHVLTQDWRAKGALA